MLHRQGCRILDKDINGYTSVHTAAQNGNSEVLRTLLRLLDTSQIEDLVDTQPHPLHLAAKNDDITCCEILINHLKVAMRND